MGIREIIDYPKILKELNETDIKHIISRAIFFLKNETPLVRLNLDRVYFVGDTHGDLQSTINIAQILKNINTHVVMLGDYIDRGPNQLENINYIFALKSEFPSRITLLRGNHELPHVNYYHGFMIETIKRFSENLYEKYCECFSFMPYSALVNDKILALHGGLAEELTDLKQIENLPKGETEPENPVALQILWNDPSEDVSGFQPSIRGSMIRDFGRDVFERFAEANGLDMMIRAHQYFAEGYHYYFDEKVLSLFTCRYYPSVDPKIASYDQGKIKLLSVK